VINISTLHRYVYFSYVYVSSVFGCGVIQETVKVIGVAMLTIAYIYIHIRIVV